MHRIGVLHMHSTYSYDGKMSLGALKELLVSKGVSFACMTEHTDELNAERAEAFVNECRRLSDDSFVFVPGFEVPYKDAHVLHIGTTEFLGQFADAHLLKAWRSVTPMVVLAHPVRNKFVVDEHLEAVIDGVEVWNQQYEGKHAPRFRSLRLLETLKQKKPSLLATCGLDLHRKEHFGTPQVELEVDSLTEASILAALKAGVFSNGGTSLVVNAQGEITSGNVTLAQANSCLSIWIITLGKFVNATMANLGLKVPKKLSQAIRSRV